jgi:hypothetical protein
VGTLPSIASVARIAASQSSCDREGAAGDAHPDGERADLGRQRLAAQAMVVEDVDERCGVEGGEALAHRPSLRRTVAAWPS